MLEGILFRIVQVILMTWSLQELTLTDHGLEIQMAA